MHIFKVGCIDQTGAAARITRALREAGINTRSFCFTTRVERYGFLSLRSRSIGEGEIVVKDEDWKSVRHQFEKLAKDRKNLGLRVSKPYYQVTLLIPDRSGALDDELQKLAINQVDIRQITTADPGPDNMALVRLILECSPGRYNVAKRVLSEHLQEESPFLATAVADLQSSDI